MKKTTSEKLIKPIGRKFLLKLIIRLLDTWKTFCDVANVRALLGLYIFGPVWEVECPLSPLPHSCWRPGLCISPIIVTEFKKISKKVSFKSYHVSISQSDKEIIMKDKCLSNNASKRQRCQMTRWQTIFSRVPKDKFFFSAWADYHWEWKSVVETCILNQSDAIWILEIARAFKWTNKTWPSILKMAITKNK
jgi:hypothetical protein